MELIFIALLAVILIAYLIFAIQIPHQSLPADVVEASGFPILLAIIALGLLAFATFETLSKIKADAASGKASGGIAISKNAATRLAIIIGMIVFYILTVTTLGFVTSMILFLIGCTTAAGSKRYVFNVIFSVVLAVSLTLIFGRLFMITLPRGVGIFMELSFLFH